MNLPIIRVRDEQGNLVDIPGIIGPPGKTPVKGEDYWTAEDKAEMVQETAAAIPAPDVSGDISQHNADKTAHADIREAIQLLGEHTHTPEALGAAAADHVHDYVSESRVNELLAGAPKIQTGSYTGNGSTSKSLTFSFVPKLIAIRKDSGLSEYSVHNGITWIGQSSGDYGATTKLNNKTFTITCSQDTAFAMNYKNYTYLWLAIG